MERLKKLKEYLKNIENLNYTTSVLRWEMDTIAPKSSYNYLIDVSTKYELESFKLSTSSDFIKLVEDVINSEEYEQLNEMQKRYIQKLKSDYYQFSRIPEDFYKEYCELVNNSLNAWVEAKNKSNYSIFKPYLIKVIESTKKYYSYMYPNANNLYDCMLNDYEEGITTSIIDNLFNELKEKIVPIIKNLKSKELTSINTKLSDSQLFEISKFMLDYIGFDNSRGALGIYTHGYTMKLNNNDVRISFSNKNVITDILSTVIHEGGHGIFEQNIDESLANIPAYDINKCALHESQSRFFENILGRNVNFWVPIYKEVKEKLKIEMTIDEFIEQFNNAKPSFIRTEADELTYCMHIIIRYEIEKDIFNDKIDLEELPNIWNKKYKEYLGLDVTSDKDGILQDMHWSEGAFGYFPSYLVGSIFDGMLLETVNKNLGNVNDLLKNGNIKEITKFLNNNIHRYGGAYNINEIANKVCRKDLEIEPLVKYFSEKYE